ncbi:ABC-type polysaccharide/polyol phosphate export permease [Aeromonas hydrophila]|uniref:hypothetical protein n=1 Tax=Aeromonas hydrophila TaxID=644 RepID=UPI0021696FE7|nr:hypothetical protein [Aeromonas hydrophila]MCS3768351.1 ABC-type polysaccharide/polyol phosphate export permease [Aeromonas hydrophila]
MMYQMVMGFAVIVFALLAALGIQFGAPWWFFFAAVPASPVLSFGVVLLTAYIGTSFEDRGRAKRRAAAAERRSQGL